MDFARLKAYMINTSIKDNVNTSTACVQKRLNMSKVKRQTNRNVRLTEFRNIPENMSACNTPLATRIVPRVDLPKAASNNISKVLEEKVALRQQRLREFKQKKDQLKREQQANKKPMFKVTHASLEKYELGKLYENNVSNKEPYKFKAPSNVQTMSFLKNSPMRLRESPRKRITRSTFKLQNDVTLKEAVKSQLKTKIEAIKSQSKTKIETIKEHATSSAPRVEGTVPKPTSERGNIQRNSKRTNIRQIEEVSIPGTSKNVINLPDGPKKINKTPCKVSVQISKIEQVLAESNLSANIIANITKPVLKTPSKLRTKQPIKQFEKISKSEEILSEAANGLEKTPSKLKPGSSTLTRTAKSLKKSVQENITRDFIVNVGPKIIMKTPSKMNANNTEISSKKSKADKTPSKTSVKSKLITNTKPVVSEHDIKTEIVSKRESLKPILKANHDATKKGIVETLTSNDEPIVLATNKSDTPKPLPKTRKSRLRSVEEINMVKPPLKVSENRRTRSNSSNIMSKCELEINSQPEIIPYDLRKSSSASNNLDVENNINQSNTEQQTFMKTPENVGANANVETKNSLKTPTQDSANCGYISPFVTVSRGKRSARKEYAERMSSGGVINSPALQQKTNLQTAAEYFTLLLDKETNKINKNCEFWNNFKNNNKLPEEAIDMIDVATGQGTLLKNKKMQSFRNLIQYSLEEQTDKPVTCMDLHGYWDVLNMQIDNVSTRFENLLKLRDNGWQEILPEKRQKLAVKKVPKPLVNTKRSNDLREAIKSARLRAKTLPAEVEFDKTPKSDKNSTRNSAKGSHKRISSLNRTPSNCVRSGSPQIMMQVSQIAKSVDRLGSEAVHSAKSILKKRLDFKEAGRKPKAVLFNISNDVFEDATDDHQSDNLIVEESRTVRRSSRLH